MHPCCMVDRWVLGFTLSTTRLVYTWSRIMPIGVLDPIPNPWFVWLTDGQHGNIGKRNKFPVQPWPLLFSSTSKIPLKSLTTYLTTCLYLFCQQLTQNLQPPFNSTLWVQNRGPKPAWIYYNSAHKTHTKHIENTLKPSAQKSLYTS